MDVLLYGTENARNLGNIVRTSAAFGLERIFLYDKFNILGNEEGVKGLHETSIGHDEEVLIHFVENPLEFVKRYENRFATTLIKGSKKIGHPDYKVKIPENSLIIFGGETRGLPRELSRSHDVQKIVIPTRGMNYCLSLPTAYAVVIYEFLRQHPEKFPKRGK
jgi:tRNA (cytidine/uridine-2'-O-)-methyltransferase